MIRWRHIAMVALAFCATAALGQGYPNKPVRIIVAFSAGGAVDLDRRLNARDRPRSCALRLSVRRDVHRRLSPAGAGRFHG